MSDKKFRVSILGDGGWGTALAVVNARCQNEVVLWSAFPEHAKEIHHSRVNEKFLPGIPLDDSIEVTSDLEKAVQSADILVLAIPTQFLRNVLHKLKDFSLKDKVIVTVSKGIERKTCLRPTEIIQSILGEDIFPVVLSGPSHAEEVARNIPTLVVVASQNSQHAELVQKAFMDTYFRIYVQGDLVGVEFGGALKNVIAVAAGVCDGLQFGDNTKSGLVSRGILEMSRLGVYYGAIPTTFFGLSGLGDLVTTCFSKHGRNLRVGRELGEGKNIKEVLGNMEMIAEGVDTAKSIHELCEKINVDLPIMNEVYKILYEEKNPRQAVVDLLNRDAHEEWKQY